MPVPGERNQVTKESHCSLDAYFEHVKNLVYICYQQKKGNSNKLKNVMNIGYVVERQVICFLYAFCSISTLIF